MEIAMFLLAWLMLGGVATAFTYCLINGKSKEASSAPNKTRKEKILTFLDLFLEKSALNRFIFTALCFTIFLIPIWIFITAVFIIAGIGYIYCIIWQPQSI